MCKFAVIDIGSNSVRLMFVADGKVLYKRLATTRLGEGLAASHCLTSEAITRSAIAVKNFHEQARAEGAEEVFAFATAAVRTAENGLAFVEKVRELCALSVEVVLGEAEAELGVLGALGTLDGAVIDMGGASTEIVVKKANALIYKRSVDIGVVRLKDECGRDKAALTKRTKDAVKLYGNIPHEGVLHAIGGTATTLAALKLQLTAYDSEKVTGTEISVAEITECADKLLSMQVEEIAALPCVSTGRADILAGGALALAVIMQETEVNKLIVSDRDNLEGYAIKKGLL